MNRESLDRGCERGILGLVFTILVFGPLATGAVRTPDFLAIQTLTLGVMVLWGLRLWLVERPRLLWPPICWAVLAFSAYALGRYLTADLEYVARGEVARVLVYAFLFLAILNNLHRQEHLQLLLLTMVFLGMGIAFYADFQFANKSSKVWSFTSPYQGRGTGTFISPNNLGGFLEMLLPVALVWLLVSRAKPLTRIFVAYAALVIISGIIVTMSRGTWIATTITLAFLFAVLLFHRTYRLPSVILLVLLIGACVFLSPRATLFKARLQKLATAEGKLDDDARFDLWRPALQLWRENPWWGIGPNHFDYRFRALRPETIQLQPDRVHNDYLNTLTDWGAAGAGLVAAAWVLLFAGVCRTWRRVSGTAADLGSRQSNKFALLLGPLLGLTALLLHSFVDFNFHIPANAILAITLMAVVSSCQRFSTEKHWKAPKLPAKLLLTLLLVLGLAGLGWQGQRSAREHHWLSLAEHAPDGSLTQMAALEKAFAIEPRNSNTAGALGENLRRQFWDDEAESTAARALDWLSLTRKLNPYDGYASLRSGLCLDRLGRKEESVPFYREALRLDPNGYFTAAYLGWHYVQLRDYAAARTCFERSRRLSWQNNQIADSYLPLVTEKLMMAATNTTPEVLVEPGQPSR